MAGTGITVGDDSEEARARIRDVAEGRRPPQSSAVKAVAYGFDDPTTEYGNR
jgi:hypothetical protein